jgi:hypothetical protein
VTFDFCVVKVSPTLYVAVFTAICLFPFLLVDIALCIKYNISRAEMSNRYLLVLTIAKRCAPFASCNETLVSLELIGVKFLIRPVTPVLLVVNKSPIWYVYPFSDIWVLPFVCGG